MNIIKSLAHKTVLKAARSLGIVSSYKGGYDVGMDFSSPFNEASFKSFVKLGFGRNPYVFMVVDKIAKTMSTLDTDVYLNGNIVESGETYDWFKRPYFQTMTDEYLYEVATMLLVTGNAIIHKIKPVGYEKVKKTQVLRTQDIELIIDNTGELEAYKYYNNGSYEIYYPNEILHIKFPNIVDCNSNKYFGMSPLQAISMVYDSSNDIFEAEAWLMKNKGVIGMLSNWTDTPILPEMQEELQKELRGRIGGAKKFNEVHVTNHKLNYLKVGMSPTDLKVLESSTAKLRVICGALGVSSALFNDSSNTTYNNMQEANKALYINAVLPLNKKILDYHNEYLLKDEFKTREILKTEYSKIEVLKTVNKDLSEKIRGEYNDGIITLTEAREALGLETDTATLNLLTQQNSTQDV